MPEKSCSVAVYSVTMDDGELLIYEWDRSRLKEIDVLMSLHVISVLMLSSHQQLKPSARKH